MIVIFSRGGFEHTERVSRVDVSGELTGKFPPRLVMGLLFFLQFLNDLPDALQVMKLLFADGVLMVTRRTQQPQNNWSSW